MKKLLIFVGLLMASPALWAESNIFTIPPQDLSMKLLNHVFGTVGTIVTGVISQTALTNVLKYFNNACLVLGGILILYSLVVSTVNTAHDGEMLGKKWNSVWIPIRAALGFGLLLPTKATLVVIQVFVMWVVVQGVGAADYLWKNTVSQPQNYSPPATLSSPVDAAMVLDTASLIYLNQVCQNITAELASTQTVPVTIKTTDTGSAIQFGISSMPNQPALCGGVGYTTKNQAATQSLVNNIANTATNQFLSIYDYNNPQPLTASQDAQIQAMLVNATKAYVGAQLSAQSPTNGSALGNQTIDTIIKNGWISAGSYYITISKMGQGQTTISIDIPSTNAPDTQDITSALGQNAQQVQDAVNTAINSSCLLSGNNEPGSYEGCTPTAADAGNTVELTIKRPTGIVKYILEIINPMYGLIQGLIDMFVGMLNLFNLGNLSHVASVTGGYNPILSIMGWGQSMINGIATVSMVMLAIMFSVGAISYTCSCVNPLGYAIGSALTWILPFVFMIMLALWLFGSLAAYYVPLIPYILFTLGGVAWIIAVIEAMVAAPLMALGILHPEGRHDIFGSATAGIMILANVFLRPSLMIVGFWGGYIMLGVVCSILNTGFLYMVGSLNNNTISPYGAVSFMGIYLLLVLILINKAFSLIYIIPDRIFRWIGGPSEDTGIAQDLGQIKQGYEGQAKKVSETEKGALQGQKDLARQKSQKAEGDGGGFGGGAGGGSGGS